MCRSKFDMYEYIKFRDAKFWKEQLKYLLPVTCSIQPREQETDLTTRTTIPALSRKFLYLRKHTRQYIHTVIAF